MASHLPPIESVWCRYLSASTEVVYPPAPGTVRFTHLSGHKTGPTLYKASALIELWANPMTSEDDAIALHALVCAADSLRNLGASITAVDADMPRAFPDPDSPLDRYQFLISYSVRTITL